MSPHFKMLIRSLGITALAWFIIPENNILVWVVLGNELLKQYRSWQEIKAWEIKIKEDIKNFHKYGLR